MRITDLDGSWILNGEDENGNAISIEASVPGCVHTDLQNAGILGDIFSRDNSKKCQWIESKDFTYVKKFTVTELFGNAVIVFDGLDTYCGVYLNGQLLGECSDMHIPYEFEADGIIVKGENTLEVKFRSPVREVEGMPNHAGAFTTERMNTRRIQCTYSWDWVDRFVTMGIYRSCRLEFREPNTIEEYYIYTADINPYTAQLHLKVYIRDFVNCGDELNIKIVSPRGKTVFSKKRIIITPTLEEYIDIPDPQLWYPNGYGEHPLYELTLETAADTVKSKMGIRRLTIIQPVDDPDSEYARIAETLKKEDFLQNPDKNEVFSGFTLLCNGIKIMCRGANWVPCDPFPSAETPDKIRTLLELGAEGGVNMLRVWGGGIFEQDAFYENCDRLGILVTQDFLMACGSYPENEEWFINALKREARAAALRLRNHCCLAWWSGDNENAVNGNENRTDFDGYRAATFGIQPVLGQLDPQRYFLASSPYGGDKYCSATRGTTHNTYYLGDFFSYVRNSDFSDYREYFSKYLNRFNAEQPAIGMPFVSSLRKFLTDEDIFGGDTSMSEYHTKNNPGLGAVTLYGYVDMMSRKIFGDFRSGEDRVLKMQLLQCEWVRLSLELFRRNKWYSSGIIYWMFNDCWPAANGWSLIDYYAKPKPAYYVFKRCSRPVIASIERKDNNLNVYICNDGLENAEGSGKLYLYDFAEKRVKLSYGFLFVCAANESDKVFTVSCEEYDAIRGGSTVLLCDIESNLGSDRAFFINDRYSDLALSYMYPEISEDDGGYSVSSETFLPFALCDTGDTVVNENSFPLLPGERVYIGKL